MLRHLTHPRVVGISEVGLDFSVPSKHWGKQEALLERILNLGTMGHVLVMHLRGGANDPQGRIVHRYVLRLLREKCLPSQRIHLHCFSGDEELLKLWLEAFPNTYFGLAGLVRSFSDRSKRAVRSIPGDRILLETDSPHLAVHRGLRCNTPGHLADVGQVVAPLRGCSLPSLLGQAGVNALRLYGP